MDYITQSEWDIFVSKIKWANSACIFMMGLISILSIIFDWFSLREFLKEYYNTLLQKYFIRILQFNKSKKHANKKTIAPTNK